MAPAARHRCAFGDIDVGNVAGRTDWPACPLYGRNHAREAHDHNRGPIHALRRRLRAELRNAGCRRSIPKRLSAHGNAGQRSLVGRIPADVLGKAIQALHVSGGRTLLAADGAGIVHALEALRRGTGLLPLLNHGLDIALRGTTRLHIQPGAGTDVLRGRGGRGKPNENKNQCDCEQFLTHLQPLSLRSPLGDVLV